MCNKCAVRNWNLFDANALQSVQHSYDVCFVARGFQMQAVPWCTCTWLLLCAEFGPLPQPIQSSADQILLHTDSMTVSHHARKAPGPGVAQYDSFGLCRDPRHDECCMNGASGHRTVTGGGCQVHREIGYPLSRRHTPWPEKMGARPCVLRAPPLGKETALDVSRVPNWTPRVRL